MKIRYTHDCVDCIFLGQHNEYDLYFCPNTPTVVARYTSHGPDYASGLVFAKPGIDERLLEAKNRAIKKGLYNE